jgi:hypothetical protein
MKNAFYILLLCVSFGYAQDIAIVENGFQSNETIEIAPLTEKLLTSEDFKMTDGRMLVTAVPCQIKNEGTIDTVLISVVCQQKVFSQFGVDKINDMILTANEKVRNSLRENSRYHPTEIKMAYIPDSNDWSLTNSFTVKDDNGIMQERMLALDFDAKGKFAVMKKIL